MLDKARLFPCLKDFHHPGPDGCVTSKGFSWKCDGIDHTKYDEATTTAIEGILTACNQLADTGLTNDHPELRAVDEYLRSLAAPFMEAK